MGASPGITNLLAAEAAGHLDRIEEIHIRLGSSDRSRYESVPALPVSYSLKTILEEFSKPPALFSAGRLKFVEPMSGADPYKFPSPVGVRRPFYTLHSEIATLPQSYRAKGVKEVSFKIAFDDDFVNKVRFLRDLGLASTEPLDIRGVRVPPIVVVDRVAMSQKPARRVGPLKQHEVVRAIVKGMKGSNKRTCLVDCHTVGIPKWGIGSDANTGCPPAIAVQLIAEGKTKARGALPPERVFRPQDFFSRLKPRGMWVDYHEKSGWNEPV
jgi:saccharopine dehydrogenase (NAD+, L-lysine-forming)